MKMMIRSVWHFGEFYESYGKNKNTGLYDRYDPTTGKTQTISVENCSGLLLVQKNEFFLPNK